MAKKKATKKKATKKRALGSGRHDSFRAPIPASNYVAIPPKREKPDRINPKTKPKP